MGRIMKKILGLDLGTNSIGWALIEQDFETKSGEILDAGSRIIPTEPEMLDRYSSGKALSKANAGQSYTPTGKRTDYRGIRRLRERHLLRRERLHRVLNLLGFLPEHYAAQIDFEKSFGQFVNYTEPKLPWRKTDDKQSVFIFQKSFNEMLSDFKQYQPQLLVNKKGEPTLIPFDWTIYYLRKKALTKKIEKEELAWIILNFNQKRGYYQLRDEEEEENPNKSVEYHSLKIVNVVADENPNGKGDTWYSLHLENGWVYRRTSKTPLFNWKDKTREFIVTTDLNDDGTVKTDKEGDEKRSFRAPSEDDWTLLKKKTEADIDKSQKTVGMYIYETLLRNPNQKIRGKLVRTIEREFYKDELRKILEKQKEFHSELQNEDIYGDCVRELYKNNQAHRLTLSKRDFVHLFLDDIIFYQRPLRSQKSSIGNCTLEYAIHKINKKDEDGNPIKNVFEKDANGNDIKIEEYLKAIPKSNPYYQEFRVWQWLYNLKIYQRDDDKDVTETFLKNADDYVNLFDFLMNRKEIDNKSLIAYFVNLQGIKGKNADKELKKYRWNYVFDNSKEKEEDKSKKYLLNKTGYEIRKRLSKVENLSTDFLTPDVEQKLWHIIYSVTDKTEFEKALKTFAQKCNLDEVSFVENFKKFPPFKNEYGSFSEKAIKKLLPLMRLGKYWNWETIDARTKDRIDKIITGEYDDEIKNRVREKTINLERKTDFQGLQLWLAQYVVYNRHSESGAGDKWNSVGDLEKYIEEFKQHSLRNPIVEQVVLETLRVVKDIWKYYGKGAKNFFNEIHIELGREMKNTAQERKRLTDMVTENENTNLRIKALLAELKNHSDVENVRPYSSMQQEILKIYEEGALNSDIEVPDDILKISKTAQPTQSELLRYKLWLEQKYLSPYTGQIISLGKLFTTEYEIEHIIPQSRYFDDSFSNKVICETAVNKLKDNRLGFEFIKNFHGQIIETGLGKTVKIFEEAVYKEFVQKHYAKNRSKREKLLMEDIPEKMIERQMNDTRYISKFISSILSNIIREEKDDEGINSKNLIHCSGKITSELKRDWGLKDIWKELILPRFERINKLLGSNAFTQWNERHQKSLPTVPPELQKGFQEKRIDHRHHAMDALVIACATRDHVNYMNNEHALDKKKNKEEKQKFRYDLRRKLCDKKYNTGSEENYKWVFKKPWNNFTVDVKNALSKLVVSFKQNIRVINKTVNYYKKWLKQKDGSLKNVTVKQEKGTNWAIRKPLHKEFVFGKIELKRIKVPEGKIIVAIRRSLDASFDFKKIETITDTGVQKILRNYLTAKNNKPELAFSPEGIEEMNNNISVYNDGKEHKPIYKVRTFEIGSRFALGYNGNKKDKYVEAAQGTNLFFAIYIYENGNRSYETIPLNTVIERLKQGLKEIPETNEKGHQLLFHLSPNDLVYVPTAEEQENFRHIDFEKLSKEQTSRIYKFVSCTRNEGYFVPYYYAKEILKNEMGTNNKSQDALDGTQIKSVCRKLKINRLGKIERAIL